jgi:branched-chain amino acid transport system permease protein
MTEVARDLYLLVAVFGLLPAVRWCGLPVLAGSAFVAVGSVATLQFERAGLPIGGAGLLAVLSAVAAGALVGVLVERAEPASVALTTWALAWLAYRVLLGFPDLSGGAQGLTRPARDTVQTPIGLSITLTPGLHVVVAGVLCVALYAATSYAARGAPGQGAVAARDDHELARSLGIPSRRVESLALAGGTAALAGAGIAVLLGVSAPADVSPLLALQLFAAALAATRSPLLGVAVIVALPHVGDWLTALLLLAAIAVRRPGDAGTSGGEPESPGELPTTTEGLHAHGLDVTLGGRSILRGLDLDVEPGQIHALIGPNGSGKTTALNALGVTRTYQRDAYFPGLSPFQQVALIDRERAWTYLDLVDLGHSNDLTVGQRRLLAVALVAATGAPVLAFDEPAAGMTTGERATLTAALQRLRQAGRAILIVEHDLRLVAATADVVTVLDNGHVAAHGTPDDVLDAVQSVYLGAPA